MLPTNGFYENATLYAPEWNHFLENQSKLIKYLFDDYDGTISPIYTNIDITKPIGYNPLAPRRWNYTILLYYLKLVEVLEPEEKVSAMLEIDEYWHDPRLAWDPTIFGDINILHMRQDRVWSPTLVAFGVNDIVDFRDQDFRLACVENTGRVYTSSSVRVSANCPMNIARFPFDTQKCQIQFCMPIFYIEQVKMLNLVYQGIINKTVWKAMGNSEWELINLTSRVDVLTYNDNFGDMELAVFEIKIRRNPMYYMYMIVFPSYVINSLSIVGVFLKESDKMAKLNMGLTNIMTMTFILGVMADKIPKTGSIPLLGVYIIINLSIVIASVTLSAFLIPYFQNIALPLLKLKKFRFSSQLEFFLGQPLEITSAVILEMATTANFIAMIGYWITDE